MLIRVLLAIAASIFFLCSIFLISATGTPQFIVAGDTYVGAFQICYGGIGTNCHSIDSSCKVSGYEGGGPITNKCSEFQAFRAFLILALLSLIALTFTSWFTIFWNDQVYKYTKLSSWILGGFCALCLLISWPCVADLTSSGTSNRGASFGLEVTTWLFQLIGLVIYILGTTIWENSFEYSVGSITYSAPTTDPKATSTVPANTIITSSPIPVSPSAPPASFQIHFPHKTVSERLKQQIESVLVSS